MKLKKISENVYRYASAVCGGIIVHNDTAVLIDVPEFENASDLTAMLKSLGVNRIEKIFLTQHRRQFVGGIYQSDCPGAKIHTSKKEADLLLNCHEIWQRHNTRYHTYHAIPDKFLPFENIKAVTIIEDEQIISWNGITIQCFISAAQSIEDVFYIIDDHETKTAFCGSMIMDKGKIHDIYTLQKPILNLMGYHGHMGGYPNLRKALLRLKSLDVDIISPAYGDVIYNPNGCIDKFIVNMDKYLSAYIRHSAMTFYFPKEIKEWFGDILTDYVIQEATNTTALPANIIYPENSTSFLIVSKNKHAILIDCGAGTAIQHLINMLENHEIVAIDYCFITHFHDDHVDYLGVLSRISDCKVYSTTAVAEAANYPSAYCLPAKSDINAGIIPLPDRHRITWEGSKITVFDFPGQTLHHSAILIDDNEHSVLFAGDSFTPLGFDDYCSGNRNLNGRGRGYNHCLDIIDEYKPDMIINNHVDTPFVYDEKYMTELRDTIIEKETILAKIFPNDVGISIDNTHIRTWPFEVFSTSDSNVELQIHITSHGKNTYNIKPILPDGWNLIKPQSIYTNELSSGSAFIKRPKLSKDYIMKFDIHIPPDAKGLYYIPINCTFNHEFIGSFTHAIMHVL